MTIRPASTSTVPRESAVRSDRPETAPGTPEGLRKRRVAWLVLAMAMMGLADLQLTLTYMGSIGMVELNPIARHMVSLGGAPQLVMFKLLTIALSAGLLYLIRWHRTAELCAWCSCAALLILTMHWVRYNEHVALQSSSTIAQLSSADHRWVTLPD